MTPAYSGGTVASCGSAAKGRLIVSRVGLHSVNYFGGVAEWLKAAACKSCYAVARSHRRLNPSLRQCFRSEGTPPINSEVQTVNTNIDIINLRIIIEGKILRIARPEQEY